MTPRAKLKGRVCVPGCAGGNSTPPLTEEGQTAAVAAAQAYMATFSDEAATSIACAAANCAVAAEFIADTYTTAFVGAVAQAESVLDAGAPGLSPRTFAIDVTNRTAMTLANVRPLPPLAQNIWDPSTKQCLWKMILSVAFAAAEVLFTISLSRTLFWCLRLWWMVGVLVLSPP